jgi:hypothetical protein
LKKKGGESGKLKIMMNEESYIKFKKKDKEGVKLGVER